MESKLKEVLSIQTESYNQFRMFAYIIRQLKKENCSYYVYNGCIYATKGESISYPCIVSHMDTVHEICEDLTVIESNGKLTGFNTVTMKQTGIGGDDKVGVFIALQCISSFDNIKAVFFRDEEVGCEGSYESDYTFFNDCNFILQCDRKGYGDFITNASGTKLSGKDFKDDIKHILKSYQYAFTTGMMTDVLALKESGIRCSMANISCGYYNPHTAYEYVVVSEVLYCLSMVKDIITKIAYKAYICDYKAPKQYPRTYSKGSSFNSIMGKYGYGIKDDVLYESEKETCECCQESAILEYVSDYNIYMCDKCIKDYVKPYNI